MGLCFYNEKVASLPLFKKNGILLGGISALARGGFSCFHTGPQRELFLVSFPAGRNGNFYFDVGGLVFNFARKRDSFLGVFFFVFLGVFCFFLVFLGVFVCLFVCFSRVSAEKKCFSAGE